MSRRVFFRAASGGLELWVTDGTAAGTMLLKEINPGSGESYPTGFAYSGSKLLFQVNDGANSVELWITDGTVDGTMPLKDIDPATTNPNPAGPAQVGDRAVAADRRDGDGIELWVTDGTDAATMLLIDGGGGGISAGGDWTQRKTVLFETGDVPV